MDLSNSVILPREDFIELATCAFDSNPSTPAQKVALLAQTLAFCAILGGSFVAATWGWKKQMIELEDKKLENEIYLREFRPGRANSDKE